MQLDVALKCLEKAVKFLKTYKESGFKSAKVSAKELVEELQMSSDEIHFPASTSLRKRTVRRQFQYKSCDEAIVDPKEKYYIEFFNVLMDQAIMSITERFTQMKHHYDFFGFLHDWGKIASMNDNELMKSCADLSIMLNDSSDLDVDTGDLHTEL